MLIQNLGIFFIDSELAPELIKVLKNLPDKTPIINAPEFEKLSARQKEVFKLVIEGYTSKEIAGQLFISEKKIETNAARQTTARLRRQPGRCKKQTSI